MRRTRQGAGGLPPGTADAATATLGSGAAIATTAVPMKKFGVSVLVVDANADGPGFYGIVHGGDRGGCVAVGIGGLRARRPARYLIRSEPGRRVVDAGPA